MGSDYISRVLGLCGGYWLRLCWLSGLGMFRVILISLSDSRHINPYYLGRLT
jgi:hypothetical protein